MKTIQNAIMEKKKSRSFKYGMLLFTLGLLLYTYNIYVESEVSSQDLQSRLFSLKNWSGSIPKQARYDSGWYAVDSAACRIPQFDPWSNAVRPYMRRMRTIECSTRAPLVASNDSAIYVVRRAMKAFGVHDPHDLRCCYRPFYRVTLRDHPSDNDIRYEKECTFFKHEVIIRNTEFVNVKCFVDEEMIYEDFHSFVPKKLKVEKRCRKMWKQSHAVKEGGGGGDGDRGGGGGVVSVLVIGTDSLSRLNMHRQMPKTVARLKDLDAVEMLGFNKVGSNSFPNLAAMLTGSSEAELLARCVMRNGNFFDECRIVWDEFQDAGFRTAFGEDATFLGMFNLRRRGFARQPTDYYLRPYLSNVEDKIGHNQPMNVMFCAGERTMVKLLFDYIMKFSLAFKDKLSFAFFWETTIGHDFLNTPRMADKLYLSLLNILQRNGVLDRLALLFVSDHGMRSGGIQKTYQGRMEDRQPHLFLVLPPRFRSRYLSAVANLRSNARRLTTHYDLHETLMDLARPTRRLSEAALRNRSFQLDLLALNPPRGISLFLQVPPNRSCRQAAIPPPFCLCLVNSTSSIRMKNIKKVARAFLKHINKVLQPFPQCSYLVLSAVKGVQLQEPRVKLRANTVDRGVFDTVIIIRTMPGEVELEGTVRQDPLTHTLWVVGAVSRLGMDETQSSCVNDTHVKEMCHCGS